MIVMMGRWKEVMQKQGKPNSLGQEDTSGVREAGCRKGMASAPGREKNMLRGPEWS